MTEDAKMTAWAVGQRATINRSTVVTVERVTPSGRAVVTGGRTFEPAGRERSGASYYQRARLEPLTDEIQAELDLVARARGISPIAAKAIEDADRWLRGALGTWGNRVPGIENVDRAERLAAAIREALL